MRILLLMIIIVSCLSMYQSYQILTYQYWFPKLIGAIDTLQRDWSAEHWNLLNCKKGIPL